MLEKLKVSNLSVLGEIEVAFSNGLNIASGETGAGKSLILNTLVFFPNRKFPKELIKEIRISNFWRENSNDAFLMTFQKCNPK